MRASKGYGFLYAASDNNKLVKIRSKHISTFLITAFSPGKTQQKLGKDYQLCSLCYESKEWSNNITFHHSNYHS